MLAYKGPDRSYNKYIYLTLFNNPYDSCMDSINVFSLYDHGMIFI